MHQHVRLQGTHEQKRRGARIAGTNHSSFHGPAKVIGDDRQASPRRAVGVLRIEWHDQRARAVVHVDGDVLGDHFLGEGDEFLGDPAQYGPRVLTGINMCELEDEVGGGGDPGAHREVEELELRVDVTQHCGRGHSQLCRDIGEGGGLEALQSEDPPGSLQKLFVRNAWWPAHL